MKYEMFKSELTAKLKERYGEDAHVEVRNVKKNNYDYDGLQIRNNTTPEISPIINLNEVFDEFTKDKWDDIDSVTDFITGFYESHLDDGNILFTDLMNCFEDWEYVKDKVYPMLVPMKNNESYVSTLVYKEFLDFAVIYYISGSDDENGRYSIKITPQLLDRYGITIDELDEQARKNNSSEKYKVLSMYKTLLNIMGGNEDEIEEEFEPETDDESNRLYIISSNDVHFGAAGILNSEVLSRAEKYVGNKFWILPSSVYEVIIAPDDGKMTKEELNEMVVSVNESEVAAQDVLSDHVYYYNAGKISIAA